MLIEIDDRATIEDYARRVPGLHVYEIGDLDDFFWPHTQWFGLRARDGALAALALIYTGASGPTLLAHARGHSPAHAELLKQLAPRLPDRFYAHLGPGLRPALGAGFRSEHHGRHLKLVLTDDAALGSDPDPADPDRDSDQGDGPERLGPDHLDELLALYAHAYPGNWFDARMLATGQYLGLRRDGALVCVAGVHVYSPRYRVAALGNITTAAAWRGRGLARRCVAALCSRLRADCETIGLNVHQDNAAALACYRGLGFVEIADYDEYMLARV